MTASNVKPSIDFKVDTTTGIGYISQRKAAELCGVNQNSVVHFFKQKSDISQGLSADQLCAVVHHYAKQKRLEAIDTLFMFSEAGARAFIYYHAGVQLHTANNKLHDPCVPVRWLCQQLGRSRASVDRTLNVSIHRMRNFGLSTEITFVNSERCVSPALIVCSMFTGKEMQRIRAWLLNIAETDALPDASTLLQLTHP